MPKFSSTRRSFLTMVSSAALIAGSPWTARANLASLSSRERAPEGADIVKLRIYPAIGICRVGGSDKWFLAP